MILRPNDAFPNRPVILGMALLMLFASGLWAQAPTERDIMDTGSEEPELNAKVQAIQAYRSGKQKQAQAEKYEEKAAEARSDGKREKYLELAKEAFEGAIRSYSSALGFDASLHDAYIGLGELFTKAGQHDQALLAYDQALELSAGDPDALTGKAEVYLATFKILEAQATYTELSQSHAKQAKELLATIRSWLEAQRPRFPPEMDDAVTDLDNWITAQEGS